MIRILLAAFSLALLLLFTAPLSFSDELGSDTKREFLTSADDKHFLTISEHFDPDAVFIFSEDSKSVGFSETEAFDNRYKSLAYRLTFGKDPPYIYNFSGVTFRDVSVAGGANSLPINSNLKNFDDGKILPFYTQRGNVFQRLENRLTLTQNQSIPLSKRTTSNTKLYVGAVPFFSVPNPTEEQESNFISSDSVLVFWYFKRSF